MGRVDYRAEYPSCDRYRAGQSKAFNRLIASVVKECLNNVQNEERFTGNEDLRGKRVEQFSKEDIYGLVTSSPAWEKGLNLIKQTVVYEWYCMDESFSFNDAAASERELFVTFVYEIENDWRESGKCYAIYGPGTLSDEDIQRIVVTKARETLKHKLEWHSRQLADLKQFKKLHKKFRYLLDEEGNICEDLSK